MRQKQGESRRLRAATGKRRRCLPYFANERQSLSPTQSTQRQQNRPCGRLESRRCLARDGHGWKALAKEDPLVAELRLLCRDEVALIQERTALINQLQSALREYYPAALEAFLLQRETATRKRLVATFSANGKLRLTGRPRRSEQGWWNRRFLLSRPSHPRRMQNTGSQPKQLAMHSNTRAAAANCWTKRRLN